MSKQKMVHIIGGGVSGLTCAWYLHQAGVPFTLYEADDRVGGRVQTDHVDGFLLDRGFQVLLSEYPEIKPLFSKKSLGLRAFRSGAEIQTEKSILRLDNPFQHPTRIFSMLFSPIGSFLDKIRLYQLIRKTSTFREEDLLTQPGISTLEFLEKRDFSSKIVQNFFKPFFGGVFLEFDLQTSSRFFQFVFQKFFSGQAVLPKDGIMGIPTAIAEQLPSDSIRLNTRVRSIDNHVITLETGEQIEATWLVLATDARQADTWLQENPKRSYLGTTCTYFAASSIPGTHDPILRLVAEPDGLIRHWTVPSLVQPSYAPAGQHLISITSLPAEPEQIRDEMRGLVGDEVDQWTFLRSYHIPQALSFMGPGSSAENSEVRPGLFKCGDYLLYPSLNAAMKSGRLVAQKILDELAQSKS